MKKYFFILWWLSLGLYHISCNRTGHDCSVKQFSFGNTTYRAQGCIINGLEQGEWFFFNAENQLTERGNYENGLRVGKWHYPYNKNDSTIIWRKFRKGNLGLVFNIPLPLKVIEDSLEYIKFSNKDTSNLFNIVLSIHSIEQSRKTIDEYYRQGEEEIVANGWTFTSEKNKIVTSNRDVYFNDYTIKQDIKQGFNVLNVYSMINDKEILEISARFSEDAAFSARLIFFSVLTNIFYNEQRLINPWEKIESVLKK